MPKSSKKNGFQIEESGENDSAHSIFSPNSSLTTADRLSSFHQNGSPSSYQPCKIHPTCRKGFSLKTPSKRASCSQYQFRIPNPALYIPHYSNASHLLLSFIVSKFLYLLRPCVCCHNALPSSRICGGVCKHCACLINTSSSICVAFDRQSCLAVARILSVDNRRFLCW